MAKPLRTIAALVTVAAVCAIALSARASAGREIHVVARGMRFYVDGAAGPNPVLRLRRGETVRIVFRNEDEGMRHDFTLPAWDVETGIIKAGASAAITVHVPDSAVVGTYACTPHSRMMRGTIAVE